MKKSKKIVRAANRCKLCIGFYFNTWFRHRAQVPKWLVANGKRIRKRKPIIQSFAHYLCPKCKGEWLLHYVKGELNEHDWELVGPLDD